MSSRALPSHQRPCDCESVDCHRRRARWNDKGDATPVTEAALQKHTKWFEKRGQQLNEPCVADELVNFAQVDLHILGVIGLEVPIAGLMKVDHDGHHLAFTQFPRSYPLPLSARQQLCRHTGANACQKSSTLQNNSSRLMVGRLSR